MKIMGKHNEISREEIRAIITATKSVLEFHNLDVGFIMRYKFQFVKMEQLSKDYDIVGRCCYNIQTIKLASDWGDYSQMVTAIIHEILHGVYKGKDQNTEYIISTLTGKIKSEVASIARILARNTYKTAAYIAHTSIAYKEAGKDCPNTYNHKSQYTREHPKSGGEKYRYKHIPDYGLFDDLPIKSKKDTTGVSAQG